MSRSKKLYILLGVFVVACVTTLAVTQIAERKEQIKNSGEPILELSSDSVQALSWEHKGETLYMEQAKDYRDLLQAVVAVAAAGVNVGRAQNPQRIIVTEGFDMNAGLL